MPLFDFQCEQCNEKFELLISKEADIICPKCGETKYVRKYFPKSNFQLRGGGWSSDGYSKPYSVVDHPLK